MTDVLALKASNRIRVLNDNFRSTFIGGQVVMTRGRSEPAAGREGACVHSR